MPAPKPPGSAAVPLSRPGVGQADCRDREGTGIPNLCAWSKADRRVHFMTDEEPPSIRIVRDRLVYANRYGELYDDDVEFRPGGVRGRYVRWQWRSMYSVAVLALADPGTALLVRNFRHSARREIIEAVKGFGDDSLPPVDVARHELREELGFTAAGLTFLGKAVADPGFADHPVHCFLATGKVDGLPHPEDSEAIRGITRFPIAETSEALASGRIEDSVTLLLLWQAYELERKGTRSARDTPVPDAGRSH
jgi:8-oxo-dGTP pyrophosphatase MutT (NUDIX family)